MLRRLTLVLAAALAAAAQTLLPAQRVQLDAIAARTLATMGALSASVAIVRGDRLVYAQAYGLASLDPRTPATPAMRYSIGSISKQFTATAMLLLAEEGKLRLDDPVGRFLPGLTQGNEVTIRELLSHTSGYQDYWPQDYLMLPMLQPTTAQAIVDQWARKPLDFPPGARWEYSNTNYVLAGLIVEKVGGEPLMQFLNRHLFTRLGMEQVADVNSGRLSESDAQGYLRYALGPPRAAPKEGRGWLFAAGELAMPASSLARWDIGMLRQEILRPASYREMETAVRLNDGTATSYGLGLDVGVLFGHRFFGHTGEVSGFTSQDLVFPDDQTAVVVLTNQDANVTAGPMARAMAQALLQPVPPDSKLEQARRIFLGLQHGQIDRSLFTANANAYFSPQALADYASSLGPLGPPDSFTSLGQQQRGGMFGRTYLAAFGRRQLLVSIYELPDGKLEQYLVLPSN